MKSLDQKLAAIRANPGGAKDFILANAKDADKMKHAVCSGIGHPFYRWRRSSIRASLDFGHDELQNVIRRGNDSPELSSTRSGGSQEQAFAPGSGPLARGD